MSPRDGASRTRDAAIERLLAGHGDADDPVTPVVAALRAERSAPVPTPELAAILAGGAVPSVPVTRSRRVPRTVVAVSVAGALMTGTGVAAAQGVLPGPVERAVTHVVNRWTPFHLDDPGTRPSPPAHVPASGGRTSSPGLAPVHGTGPSPQHRLSPVPGSSGANGSGSPARLPLRPGSAAASRSGASGDATPTVPASDTSAAPTPGKSTPGKSTPGKSTSSGPKPAKSSEPSSKAAKSKAPQNRGRSEAARTKAPKSKPPKSQPPKPEKSKAPKSPQPAPSVVEAVLGLIVPIR